MPKELNQRIRVALIDDDPQMRALVEELFQTARCFRCVGCFSTAVEIFNALPKCRPRAIMMNLRLPDLGGPECINRLRKCRPRIKIVVVSELGDEDSIEAAMKAGADAYLVKPITVSQCVAALKFAVFRKRQRSTSTEQFTAAMPSKALPLTPRDDEVMRLLAQGLLYKEIADKLGMSYSAVHKHQHHIFKKLGASNRVEAIRKWRKRAK